MIWKSINSLNKAPEGRWGHTCITIEDKLYLFGGFDGNYLNDFYTYDFDTKQWSSIQQGGQIPEPRSNHTMCSFEDSIYVQGGGGANKGRFGDIFQYKQNQWKKLQITLISRTYHASCIGGKNMFIFGGESGQDLNTMEIIDLKSIQHIKFIEEGQYKPEPRRFSTIIHFNNQLILIGGCTQSYQPTPHIFISQIEESNQEIKLKWKRLDLTFSKWGHSCHIFDDLIYIFGGRDTKDSNELLQYDIAANKISYLETKQNISARRKHCASIIGNSLVVFGGFNGQYQKDFSFFELPLPNTIPLSIKHQIKPYQEISQFDFENSFYLYDDVYFIDELYDAIIQTKTQNYGISRDKMIETSGYFMILFKSDFQEKEQCIIDLSYVDNKAFGIVLIYSYQRKLILPILDAQELFNLLELCDYLDMQELKHHVSYYIAQTVDKNTLQLIYNLSVEHQNCQLQNLCAYKISELKMPLQEIDNLQIQQVNNMKKIRKLSLMND